MIPLLAVPARATAATGNSGAVSAAAVGAPPGDTNVSAPFLPTAARTVTEASVAGAVLPYGTAGDDGSMAGDNLDAPIVGMACVAGGGGYWLTGSDGGVFAFGAAHYYGSAAGQLLAQPVVGIVVDADTGYWLIEGGGLAPSGQLFTAALTSELEQRSGVISASVLDLDTGALYQYSSGQEGITASIVKVEILGTLLTQAQAQGRSLTAAEESLATSMIEESDNDSATSLWDEVGGAPAVAAFDDSVGMASTTPNAAWGLTTTTARDQITLLEHLVEANPILNPTSRAYELGLMESVEADQAWGVSAGTAPGTTVALKNGWLPVGSGWTVNSIGWIDGSGHNYLIAVLTDNDPSESYGIGSISTIAEAAWTTLVH